MGKQTVGARLDPKTLAALDSYSAATSRSTGIPVSRAAAIERFVTEALESRGVLQTDPERDARQAEALKEALEAKQRRHRKQTFGTKLPVRKHRAAEFGGPHVELEVMDPHDCVPVVVVQSFHRELKVGGGAVGFVPGDRMVIPKALAAQLEADGCVRVLTPEDEARVEAKRADEAEEARRWREARAEVRFLEPVLVAGRTTRRFSAGETAKLHPTTACSLIERRRAELVGEWPTGFRAPDPDAESVEQRIEDLQSQIDQLRSGRDA